MNKFLKAFFVGSSFPVIIWPFLYLGLSFTFNPSAPFRMGVVAITLPIILGLVNVIFVRFVKPTDLHTWLFGGLYGLLMSLYGNFVAKLPTELFLLSGSVQYLTIPFAVIAYALIWRYIVKPLNEMVGI